MSARSKSCVLLVSFYLSWQFSFAISHVSADILVKSSDISGDRDTDLESRAKSEEAFDLQSDGSSKKTYEQGNTGEMPVYENDHITTEEEVNKNVKRKNNVKFSDPIDQSDAYESNVRRVLWSTKHDVTPAAVVTDPKAKLANGINERVRNSSNDHHRVEDEEIHQSTNVMYGNNSWASLDHIVDDRKIQNSLLVSSKLSVSEDKLRTYTLAAGQRYGVGRAKPKHITAQLSKAKVIEYSEEEDAFSE